MRILISGPRISKSTGFTLRVLLSVFYPSIFPCTCVKVFSPFIQNSYYLWFFLRIFEGLSFQSEILYFLGLSFSIDRVIMVVFDLLSLRYERFQTPFYKGWTLGDRLLWQWDDPPSYFFKNFIRSKVFDIADIREKYFKWSSIWNKYTLSFSLSFTIL